ncbi:hypothetical protein ACQ4PT_004156 [Festuca glaucescens]
MDTPAACEIERLPEELLVHVISLTSPADAFRATAISRAFHVATDSDTVWSRFLRHDLPRFAKKELPRKPPSTKKGQFRCLADEPVLLPRKFMVHTDATGQGYRRQVLHAFVERAADSALFQARELGPCGFKF